VQQRRFTQTSRQPVTKKAIAYFRKLNMSDSRQFIILSVLGCFWDMKIYL